MTENAVNESKTEQVAPAPATPEVSADIKATDPVSEPTASPVEDVNKKQTAAFIKMRQEARELKRQLAEAKANVVVPPPVTVVEPQAQVKPEAPTVPAQVSKAVNDIEEEGKKAIEQMAIDKEVASVPGAIMDILDICDSDPRIIRLYMIDPTIALREAKAIWSAKTGISTPPSMPKPTTPSGGMRGGKQDLEVMMRQIDNYRPGTKEFTDLANKINALTRNGI